MRQLPRKKPSRLIPVPAVIQRVKSASVTVDNQLVSSIGRGLLVLAGVGKGDDEKEADSLISRIIRCRLWPDDSEKQVGDRSYYSLTGTMGANEESLDSGRRMSRTLKERYSAVWLPRSDFGEDLTNQSRNSPCTRN